MRALNRHHMRRAVTGDHLESGTGNSVGDFPADPRRREQILFADNHEGRRRDAGESVDEALAWFRARARDGDRLLVTGSHVAVAEVLRSAAVG